MGIGAIMNNRFIYTNGIAEFMLHNLRKIVC